MELHGFNLSSLDQNIRATLSLNCSSPRMGGNVRASSAAGTTQTTMAEQVQGAPCLPSSLAKHHLLHLHCPSLNPPTGTQTCPGFYPYSTNNSWKSLQFSSIADKNCQFKAHQHSVNAGARPSTSHSLPPVDLLATCTSASPGKTEDAIEGSKEKTNSSIHFVLFPVP